MSSVLITGATGFIGSALAASFLERGGRVVCLSRGKDAAERTRAAIRASAEGFGLSADLDRVQVLPYDLEIVERDHKGALADLTAVWHCAAHMTFSRRKLNDALDFNVGGTRQLLELVARHAQGRPRFYYMSTAYTGGVGARRIPDELHLSPRLVNPYFVSKWAAELVLEKLSRSDGGLPVSIYRPTIVIGHTETGWYGGQSFGLYNFLDGFHLGAQLGGERLRIDIAPEVMHNYIPVDDVVGNCTELTFGDAAQSQFEVLQDVGTDNSNLDRVAWISEGTGQRIDFGRPRTLADHAVDLWVAVNKPFNQSSVGKLPFPFESQRLGALLGAKYRHHPLDRALHVRLIEWYRHKRLKDVERKLGKLRGFAAARLAHKVGVQALLPRRLLAGLLAKSAAPAYLESNGPASDGGGDVG